MPLRACLRLVLVASALAAGCGSDRSSSNATARPDTGATEGQATAAPGATDTRRAVKLVKVGSFDAPVFAGAPAGDRRRLFVVERWGRIMVVRGGRKLSRPFLDIRSSVKSGGEQGLLSVAFAPDYERSRKFYVDYTDRDGNTRIVEFQRSGSSADVAAPATRRQLLEIDQPESNHNGGQLEFGPDGLLYIGMGDGGGADDQHGSKGNAQNLDSLLGKLLRIDPNASGGKPYGIPSDNPYAKGGGRPEVYSYGLRNPWRFSFDSRTGAISIADVGQNNREEIDYRTKGGARGVNFGWRVWEGTRREFPDESAPGAVKPVLEYDHDDDGWCSVIGGYVVRDKGLSGYYGRYIYGDYCNPSLYVATLRQDGGTGARKLGVEVRSLSSFGVDGRGRLYAMSESGPVYRLASG